MGKLTKLKLRILEEGLTQREISRRSGLDEATVSLISNGRYIPDPLQRAKIAQALRTDPDEIFQE